MGVGVGVEIALETYSAWASVAKGRIAGCVLQHGTARRW